MAADIAVPPVQVPASADRALMPLPPPGPSMAVSARLRACDLALPAMLPCAQPCKRLWASRGHPQVLAAVRQLRHRLSPHMQMPVFDLLKLTAMEAEEVRIYQQWFGTVSEPLSMADVRRFVALSTGREGSLRTVPIWIRSRDGRTQLPMVPAEHGARQWAELLRLIADGKLGAGTRGAVDLLALVNNAHAFGDGNGRLGRALFNFCLHCAGLPIHCFIPLKTISLLSHGGYEIRLREAELYGRWDGIYSYHCTAIELFTWLGRQPFTSGQNEDI